MAFCEVLICSVLSTAILLINNYNNNKANKRPPGRFRKHLSKNDPRSYLGARIKFDPRVHFLLLDVSFGSTSTAFSTLTEDNIEMAMQ